MNIKERKDFYHWSVNMINYHEQLLQLQDALE